MKQQFGGCINSTVERGIAVVASYGVVLGTCLAIGNGGLQNMITWFNDNQGFVLSLLTAVYVTATLVILVMMTKSNELASRSIATSQKMHAEQNRPHAVFDIICRDRMVYADICNYGKTPAFDVSVELEPDLPPRHDGEIPALLQHPIGMLAPGRLVSDLLDSSVEFHRTHPLRYTGTIRYRDALGSCYEERFEIDLQYYVNSRHIMPPNIAKEVEDLKKRIVAGTGGAHRCLQSIAKRSGKGLNG